jgi:3-methylcrotonyl-CoA carboxylase alpha subunit
MEYEYRIGDGEHAVTAEKRGTAYIVSVDGRELDVDLAAVEAGSYSLLVGGEAVEVVVVRDGSRRYVVVDGRTVVLTQAAAEAQISAAVEDVVGGVQTIRAPMPGKVVKVVAAEGDAVEKGRTVVVVEAMKMEHPLAAAGPGVVKRILCQEGQNVDADQLLAEVEIEGSGG